MCFWLLSSTFCRLFNTVCSVSSVSRLCFLCCCCFHCPILYTPVWFGSSSNGKAVCQTSVKRLGIILRQFCDMLLGWFWSQGPRCRCHILTLVLLSFRA
ncbi:hypothetical protein BKA70DRAFT_853970 [Coprinopsis sp. MPI-PUGE-AT-0042]|nr:hypothetical protein BKA70DRAFT_853970 [Coprinopsis sp. MPI-PUGE-AT-0042]